MRTENKQTPEVPAAGQPHSKVSLRQKAEKAFQEMLARSPEHIATLSPENLHELRVHQIELEMQNEELRQTQADLDASRVRYFDLYDLAPVGYITVSEKGMVLEANLTATTLLGVDRGALLKQPVTRLVLKEDQDIYFKFCRQLFETGKPQQCDLRVLKPDGTTFWVHLNGNAAQDENGAPVCRVVLSDITRRKQAEEMLQEQGIHLEAILEAAADGILAVDNKGKVIRASRRFSEIWRIPESIMESGDDNALLDFALTQLSDPDAFLKKVQSLYDSDAESFDTVAFKDGRIIERSSFAMIMGGACIGRVWSFRDITQAKRDEEALAMLALRNKTLLQSASDGIHVLDDRGNVVEANEVFCRMLGYTHDEAMRLNVADWDAQWSSEDLSVKARGFIAHPGVFETRHRRKDGTLIDVEINGVGVTLDGRGYLYASARDITERKRLEAYRELVREVLQALNDPGDLQESIQRILAALKKQTGLDAAGIRLQDGDDFPYFVQDGFPKDFLLTENSLVERAADGGVCRGKNGKVCLECACGLVVSGKTDPANPLFTAGGSFWTNDSPVLLDIPPDEDPRHHPRNQCIHHGYASIALIPIRSRDGIVGLIQLNDRRKGCFTLEIVEILESIAAHIGEALMRKQAEDETRASEVRFRSYFELPLHGRCVTSPEKGWLEVNDRLCEILGYTREEILSKTWAEMTHPEDLAADVAQFDRILSGEIEQYKLEKRFIRKDGRVIWSEISVGCIRKSDGTVEQIICVMEDISERIKTALELRALEEQYRDILKTAMDGFCINDREGRIQSVNTSFCQMTGYSKEELLTMGISDLEATMTPEEVVSTIQKIIAKGGVRFETRHRRKDGKVIDVEVSIQFRPSDNTLVSFHHDITKRKEMDAKLLEALDRAEAGSRAKSEFLGVMSHELRTPLNGVLGFSELLSDTPLDDEQKGFVRTISSSGEHLLAIVSDILDFSSIEHGSLALQAAPLSIADLMKKSGNTVLKTAAEKGLEFRCEVAAGVPEQITGDERRIRQILINLLGNAVKCTAGGSVVFRVAPASDGGRHFLDFSVEDTGIGISPETLGCLFQPFVQADSKKNRLFGGTGLGLAISRRLAEAMGGAITVASTPDKGSTFTFRLPLEVSAGGMAAVPSHLFIGADGASPSSPSAETPMPPEGKLVLVVDDDQASSVIAGKMLQKLGFHVEFASNGLEAIKAFVPGKFSAILMDMSMPVMDGLEATKKIREIETAAGCHVPIIAFTANVMPGDCELCLAAGMDDFLSKPFKKEELAAKLARAAKR